MSDVLICGAGPTGLAMALWLARKGVDFRIIDKASGPGQQSRAMTVHARTLEFYRQLGFAETLVDEGFVVERMHVLQGGRQVAAVTLADAGRDISPYPFVLSYPQDLHEAKLIGQLGALGIAVEWETELVSFDQNDTGVTAQIKGPSGEERINSQYLYGADGAHSLVRRELELSFAGGTYEQSFFVADAKVAGQAKAQFILAVGPNSLMLRIPVRMTGMERLIGLVPLGIEAENLRFADIQADVERQLSIEVSEVNWSSVYRAHHRVVEAFGRGRVFVGGDAAHLHSPAGGQGMNTGIGDSFNLAWKLAEVLQGRATPALLETYHQERHPFAMSLVKSTDRVMEMVIGNDLGGRVMRRIVMPYVMGGMTRFRKVQRLLFNTVSQVRIRYPGSDLSAAGSAKIRAGDRLPWFKTRGGDNYQPLTSLDWQIHAFGDVPAGLDDHCERAGLDLHRFEISEAAQAKGFENGLAYLVRPDGHVATSFQSGRLDELEAYRQAFALSFR